MVKFLIFGLCSCVICSNPLQAQIANGMAAIKSRSGQFVACASHGLKPVPSQQVTLGGWAFGLQSKLPPRSTDAAQELDPALLTVSCERLKDALLAELKMNDQWRGRINLNIDSSMPEDAEPSLTAVLGPTGWRYEVNLPSAIKSERLLRALVNVMLLEMANRNAKGESSAQVPLWLVDGLMAHIQANSVSPLLMRRQLSNTGNRVAMEGLEPIRTQLRSKPPLSFQELSWPAEDQLSG
jgi:hypothetical protein